MDTLQFTFIAALAFGGIAIAYILATAPKVGSAILAAMLAAAFAAYTAGQIYAEGVVMFWENHTANLTGIQVWWDLINCVVIALFFIAPRARAAGMNVWLWGLFAAASASIGLLAMCARLFWLEAQAKPAAAATK